MSSSLAPEVRTQADSQPLATGDSAAQVLAANLTNLYEDKQGAYFSGARQDMIDRLPKDRPLSILEIGCGDGSTGALAMEARSVTRYDGIELDERAAAIAERRLTSVLLANAEHIDLSTLGQTYDVLIMSEVLEHLVDPWSFLRRAGAILNADAMILASSPNAASFPVVRALVAGRFDYKEQGVMDRTHLRWFTPATYCEMFESVGFTTLETVPLSPWGRKGRLLNWLSARRLEHLWFSQTMYIGRYSQPNASATVDGSDIGGP